MKYWQIIYRTGEEDWETKEVIISDEQYKLVQEVIRGNGDYIVLKDKPTIKRTSIVSINDAGEIVASYQRQGIKIDGLLEPAEKPRLISDGKPIKTDIERKAEMFKKMRADLSSKGIIK